MKNIFFATCLLVASSSVLSQNVLSTSCNLPRFNDRLLKQQVECIDPGKSGLHQLWNFSNLKSVNESYELKYLSLGIDVDTIVGVEHRTMYYYQLKGDSLLSLGYENPTMTMRYRKPETFLIFPFPYGRVFTDYFEGKGNYCNKLELHVQGKVSVEADATGIMILPDNDTLQHVLRVHSLRKIVEKNVSLNRLLDDSLLQASAIFEFQRDSIEYHLINDSIRFEVESWRWYASGYRYPVFETVISTIYYYNRPQNHFSTSFFYPPHGQYYDLSNDTENQNRRDLNDEIVNRLDMESVINQNYAKKGKSITYEFSIDSQGGIRLNYSLFSTAEVSVSVFDLQGRQLSGVRRICQDAGNYQETLLLDKYPSGEYLLRIAVGDEVYGEKFFNR